MHKSDRTAAGCTVEDEPYKLLERDAEKSILAGPLRFPPGQLPFSTSLKAPVPFTHDAVTVPVMFGPNITGKHANPNFQIFDAQYFGKGLSGAFTLETTSNRRGILNSDGAYSGANFLFDASRSNSTYGSSSMVQPASTRLLACIKI